MENENTLLDKFRELLEFLIQVSAFLARSHITLSPELASKNNF